MSKRVLVVGAGASGLAAVKQCLEEGLEPVCLEQRQDLGGLWNYVPDPDGGRSSVIKATVANTCKETYCFSDFPPPAHFPVFMPNQKLTEYLRLYAKHFDLEKRIRYGNEVLNIVQATDFISTGRWDVTFKSVKAESLTGEYIVSTETFDAVILCHGRLNAPTTPPLSGRESFRGRQLHANEYRVSTPFTDRRVVVVGMGNSAVDVACDLARDCKQVFISTRRGSWYFPRLAAGGVPFDLLYNRHVVRALMGLLPAVVRNYIGVFLMGARHERGPGARGPLCRFETQLPIVSDEIATSLLTGRVKVKGCISQLTEHSVTFEDGTTEDDLDAIIYATGYSPEFPFLNKGIYEATSDGKSLLYKFVFPPSIDPPTLAVIGFVEAVGSLIPLSELQGRWAARVIKGVTRLPSRERMLEEIATRNELIAKTFEPSERHGVCIEWIAALDGVAEEIGCKPNLIRLLLTDPRLAFAIFFGPALPVHYRLSGPGAWPPARRTALTVWGRLAAPRLPAGAGAGAGAEKGVGGSWEVGKVIKLFVIALMLFWVFVF